MEDFLASLSEDQAAVLDLIEEGKNATVQANPGSGKTHLILQIASAFPAKNILVLSFNTALVGETDTKLAAIRSERSGWTHAHTYHGLLGTLVDETVYDDMILGQLLNSVDFHLVGQSWKYRDVDLLVIDEAQDLKERFVLLILVILAAIVTNKTTLRMVLLFDDKQTLYSFYPINKADPRFAMLASAIYGPFLPAGSFDFTNVVLPVSYRLAPQSVTFLNALLPGRNLVSGHTTEEPHNYVTLYLADVYRDAAAIVLNIVRQEAGVRHSYGEILILVNSLRSKRSPARAVVDMLVASNIPVHVLRGSKHNNESDEQQQQQQQMIGDVRKNKVNFLTDCGAKGLQFRTVIKINETELLDQQFITNPRFVALTRHSKRLYIIQNARNTTQTQIDALLSHPQITQRVLRVIAKRQIPMELSEKASRVVTQAVTPQQEQKQDTPPCLVPCETLFSFLDVDHLENLMQHINIVPMGAAQFDCTLQEGCERFLESSAVSQYMSENVIAQADNNTYIDVMRVVNHALALALEFFFTERIPKCISAIAERTRFSDHPQEQCMSQRLEDPMFEVSRLRKNDESRDIFFDRIIQHMSLFAIFAVVADAEHNYRDLLFQLHDFSFANTPAVKLRLQKLRLIFESLFELHKHVVASDEKGNNETTRPPWCWATNVTGHFVDNKQTTLDLTAHLPLVSEDRLFFIFVSMDADISNDDRLHAVAATMAARTNTITDFPPHMFVVNFVSLAVEQIELTSNLEQPVACTNIVIGATAKQHKVVRFTLCDFLAEAMLYKFWDTNAIDDSTNSDEDLSNKRPHIEDDDDEAFVARIHKRLKTILENKN